MLRYNVRPYRLVLNREMIEITSSYPSWSDSWVFTDAAGHTHRHTPTGGFPTLRQVVDASHWCDGTEGFALHDPHEQIDESHFECVECGEVITPATDPPFLPKYLPGPVSATLSGPKGDGRDVVVWITDVELAGFDGADEEAWRAHAERLLSDCPEDRIIEWTARSAP